MRNFLVFLFVVLSSISSMAGDFMVFVNTGNGSIQFAQAPNPIRGAQVSIRSDDGTVVTQTTSSSGIADFGALPPGNYVVTTYSGDRDFASGVVTLDSDMAASTYVMTAVLETVPLESLSPTDDQIDQLAQGVVDDLAANSIDGYSSESTCEVANPNWDCFPTTVNGVTTYLPTRYTGTSGGSGSNPAPGPTPVPTPVPTPPPPQDSAIYISESVPTNMVAGQSYNVSITFQNTGITTWNEGYQFRLGSQNPQDNITWSPAARIFLASGENVAPGATKTFSFKVTAPSTVGSYNFQWRMVHEYIDWFGNLSPNVSILVSAPVPTPTPTPVPTPTPAPRNTKSFVYNSSTGTWVRPDLGKYGTWAGGWSVYSAQLNSDSMSDLFLYNKTSGQWVEVLDTATGDFTYLYGSYKWAPGWDIYVGKFNSDNLDDLFLYNKSTGQYAVGLNDGKGGFNFTYGLWAKGWDVKLGRFNSDSFTDILVYNSTNGMAAIITSNGTGGFNYSYLNWAPGWTTYVADLNGDGIDDVFTYNASTGKWCEALNLPTGFSYPSGTWGPGWSMTVGKFNSDKSDDLFLYNPITGLEMFAFSDNKGNFTFSSSATWATGWNIQKAELNSNSMADLFLYSPSTGLYFNAVNNGLGNLTMTGGTWAKNWNVILQK